MNNSSPCINLYEFFFNSMKFHATNFSIFFIINGNYFPFFLERIRVYYTKIAALTYDKRERDRERENIILLIYFYEVSPPPPPFYIHNEARPIETCTLIIIEVEITEKKGKIFCCQ